MGTHYKAVSRKMITPGVQALYESGDIIGEGVCGSRGRPMKERARRSRMGVVWNGFQQLTAIAGFRDPRLDLV